MIESTTLGNIVTQSRSRNVNTVSRCMCARSRVMPAAITRSAAPFSNSASAIFSIIWPVVRSLIPMATVRLPIGMMSPPSELTRPNDSPSCSREYQNSKPASRKAGWKR